MAIDIPKMADDDRILATSSHWAPLVRAVGYRAIKTFCDELDPAVKWSDKLFRYVLVTKVTDVDEDLLFRIRELVGYFIEGWHTRGEYERDLYTPGKTEGWWKP